MRARQDEHTPSSLNGVSSEIERMQVSDYLADVSALLRVLRDEPGFWLSLGPAFRVRYEDFQGDLAALRAAWRK